MKTQFNIINKFVKCKYKSKQKKDSKGNTDRARIPR